MDFLQNNDFTSIMCGTFSIASGKKLSTFQAAGKLYSLSKVFPNPTVHNSKHLTWNLVLGAISLLLAIKCSLNG